MAVQDGDILYAERTGIPGKVTAKEIAERAYTVYTQSAFDALSQPERDASGLVLIIG